MYKEYKDATNKEICEGIVFPVPSAIGAFTGYKISYFLIELVTNAFLKMLNNI